RNLGLDDGVDVAELIRMAAAQLFHARGYGSTSIRDIATAAGVSSSTMYHHYKNKQDVLFAITRQFMVDFTSALTPPLQDQSTPAMERLEYAVRRHLEISTERRAEWLTSYGNRSALSTTQLNEIVGMQLQYQSRVRDLVQLLQDPDTEARDTDLVTMALMDVLNGVCRWFDPKGPLSIEQIADRYVELAKSIVVPHEYAVRRERKLAASGRPDRDT
ncbi:MAG: TetR/AcrR family transcriptional regulator, partial [bacterium]